MQPIVNVEQAEAWNGPEGRHWADHAAQWDAVSAELNEALLTAAGINPDDRVLDLGCGNGQTTRLAARRARDGSATGVDLSGPMLQAARTHAAGEGLTNVRFEQGDVQVYRFPPGEFDVALSRGGLTFFADPAAAFTNIAHALRPGGRLAFTCARAVGDQQWFTVFMTALAGRVPRSDPRATYEPGMFSLADPQRIDELLTAAGFRDITITGLDPAMTYGHDAADAAQLVLGSGPARALLENGDRKAATRARIALTTALGNYEQPDGVQLKGAFWLVTAATEIQGQTIEA
ncbi:methyltransferase domain-containing protein [Micromonospora yasonensis]|uniref:class I SAM-dependent methyltransferase n=1 Tax=Micromonospora yasonensis TaxID=1128667 RepID=UPI0022327390|nr:class I SAM-dependent methyltransferase [Micromonospora yasonensis]MCW3839095.1 methyltransferase domain-containing protein [Micromonospora yasonensis]